MFRAQGMHVWERDVIEFLARYLGAASTEAPRGADPAEVAAITFMFSFLEFAVKVNACYRVKTRRELQGLLYTGGASLCKPFTTR